MAASSMTTPHPLETFRPEQPDALRAEIRHLGLDIPVSDDLAPLASPLSLGGKTAPNRFCALPMEGGDAEPDGSPGPLTFRRYRRFARGGFGLIWIEAVAVADEARSGPAQLRLRQGNVAAFARLAESIRQAAAERFGWDVVLILQLAHSGRYSRPDGTRRPVLAARHPARDKAGGIAADHPLATDAYLDALQDAYVEAARLAARAGFDGVDVKSCHGDLVSDLDGALTRPGRYGGTFENRTRFLANTLARIREDQPGRLTAVRLGLGETVRGSCASDANPDPCRGETDIDEPLKLVALLRNLGTAVLGITTGQTGSDPRFETPSDDTGAAVAARHEHPLLQFHRGLALARRLQKAFPDLPVVGCGYTWLRHCLPFVTAGLLRDGSIAAAGVGRGALAYPDAPADILETGRMDPAKSCLLCSACDRILRDGGSTGCVIHDSPIYGAEYRHRRRFAMDHLLEQARRCHNCRPAPCILGCPARIDVPAFVKAFERDDIGSAFRTIRRSNVLPEMCARLCPTWMQCEGACVESTLTAQPIPIRDLQYAVCWLAREEGLTALRLDGPPSGRCVAVVGGGPAGSAAAIRLLDMGHRVTIFEREARLGGTPELVIPAGRFAEAQTELNAILRPALDAGVLELAREQALGAGLTLADLTRTFDAVLLAAGLWQERTLGTANGVMNALAFLKRMKSGSGDPVPARVAVLSGGDAAMDAALTAKQCGATDVYVVYGGTLADMHWHLPDDWFRTSGAHGLMLTQPLGYTVDAAGRLTGLRVCRTEYGPPDGSGARRLERVPGSESVLRVDAVIEAMGPAIADELKPELAGLAFTPGGLIDTGGADSFATGLEKVFAAGALINGGASVAQCVAEGMKAAEAIDRFLKAEAKG